MAVRFDATGEGLSRTSSPPSTAGFTVCGWANLSTDRNTYQILSSIDNGSTQYAEIGTDSDGTTLYIFNHGAIGASLGSLTVGTPFFWAQTVNGSGAGNHVGYGRNAGTNTLTVASQSGVAAIASQTFWVGRDGFDSGAYYFDGRIWNVKVWDRVLTAAELLVESYYAEIKFPASKHLHWRLPNSANTTDSSGLGRNATVTGTLSTEDGSHGLWKPSRRIFIPAAAAGGTAALTGVAGTSAVGTVKSAIDYALSGSAGTGAVGTLVNTASYGLSGNAATGAVGTVSPAISDPLTGTVGTGAAGTLTATAVYGVSGNAGTGAVGSVTANLSGALSGASATGSAGVNTPNITYALTGVAATGAVGTLTPVTGTTLDLTGVAGTGEVGTVLANVDYGLSGNVGTGAVGTLLASLAQGLSGNAATGNIGSLTANLAQSLSGASATGGVGTNTPNISYALSGVQATGAVGTLTAVVGNDITYALTGVQATGEVGNLTAVGGDVAATSTAAGRSRRKSRHRYVVEIDGEEFIVSSPEEAEAILREAKELAHQRAQQAIERAQKATKRPKPKVLADAKKAMPEPKITASVEIQPVAVAMAEEIRDIYRDAMRAVEMIALMRRADEEEEESILLLLM